jgi:hypothetical protein
LVGFKGKDGGVDIVRGRVGRCKRCPGLIEASEIAEAQLMERRRLSDAFGRSWQGPIPWAGCGPSGHDS